MLVFFSVFLFCIFLLEGALVLISPGKPEPFLEADGRQMQGSISVLTGSNNLADIR
jgi:hypothetical protein